MRKLIVGMAAIGMSLAMGACTKTETAANEAVAEEPMANESMDANASMDMNATEDMNAAIDMNAADANVTEQGSTDH